MNDIIPASVLSRLAKLIIISTTIAGSVDKEFTDQNKMDMHKMSDNNSPYSLYFTLHCSA